MYLNEMEDKNAGITEKRLIRTWDVFKSLTAQQALADVNRLIRTWDVFKYNVCNSREDVFHD